MPYSGAVNYCSEAKSDFWINDYCVRSKFYYNSNSRPENLDDATILRALVQKGPLYITLNASPLEYRNVRGGMLDEPNCSTQINHAVLLVGYDQYSFIIKNR